jgi:hypothetical protein
MSAATDGIRQPGNRLARRLPQCAAVMDPRKEDEAIIETLLSRILLKFFAGFLRLGGIIRFLFLKQDLYLHHTKRNRPFHPPMHFSITTARIRGGLFWLAILDPRFFARLIEDGAHVFKREQDDNCLRRDQTH